VRRSGRSMNRKDRDRGAEMRLTERTRKLIPETRGGVPRCGLLLLLLPTEPSSVVCRSVGRSVCRLVCHTSKLCKNGRTDQDVILVEDLDGPREPRMRRGWSISPMEGAILRGEGRPHGPIIKYRDTLQSSVQKRLNRSRCRLVCGSRWAQGIMC